MEQKIFVLCDPEEEYARHMSAFLRKEKELPWQVVVYTEVDELIRFGKGHPVQLLLIAESAFREDIRGFPTELLVILNESGLLRHADLKNIDKYQPAENVLKELLAYYADQESVFLPRLQQAGQTRLIGMYSPVRRCLQTTFALVYARLLAEEQHVLYLNFEHYTGVEELMPRQDRDLCALLYYLQTNRANFLLRMRTFLRRDGNLDYMAPVFSGQNLLYVTVQEWKQLLNWILDSGNYDYVVMDLSDNMQGLYEILRLCSRVYTIVKEDAVARRKISQYEQLLALYEYGDVLEKTKRCELPLFRELPEMLDQYTQSDLAEYVRGLLREEAR